MSLTRSCWFDLHNLLFFFNDTATTEIYTLSLPDALPIYRDGRRTRRRAGQAQPGDQRRSADHPAADRKSTRLNSSHLGISYAVFCVQINPENHTGYTYGWNNWMLRKGRGAPPS